MAWGKRGDPGPCKLWGGWMDGTGPVASLAAYLLAGLGSLVIKGCSVGAGFSCFFLSFFFVFFFCLSSF